LKAPPKSSEAVRQAAQVEREAVSFFRRANRLAADPRVKFIFSRAAEEHENALKVLEPLAKGRGKPRVPSFFPVDEYATIECSVCGHSEETDEIPETCPSCGAAGYAFDKDVPRDLAWSLVARTARNVAAFTRKMGAGVKDPEAKNALTMAAGIHRDLLAEANEERARLEGAAP